MAELVVSATDFDVLHKHHALYTTAHGAAVADWRGKRTVGGGDFWYYDVYTTDNGWGFNDYQIGRGFLLFDTSGLGAGATISSAILSLYHMAGGTETDPGQAILHVVEGIQNTPLVLADYGAHLTKIISGGSITEAQIVAVPNDFFDIDLNPTGLGWINPEGMTKLCLRVAGDKDNGVPTGKNGNTFGTTDGWNGNPPAPSHFPKLTITYTAMPAFNRGFALAREEL